MNNRSLKPSFFSVAISWVKAKIIGSELALVDDTHLVTASRALRDSTPAKWRGATFIAEITATMKSCSDAVRLTNTYARTYIDDQVRLREEAA